MSLSAENPMSMPTAFNQLFYTYSAEQIIAMVHSVERANGQSGTTETKVTKRSLIAHPKKKTSNVAAPSKATRPLNSWMAFRSYYSSMFTSLQQKDISGFLTHLWQADPFKAKWSILAKAYSLIRDSKGKDKAPLDSFLAINGPLIGIVPPEEYLEMLGWTIVAGDDGGRILRRDFDVDVSSFDQDLLTTNVSVNNIIEYSYACGYVAGDEANLIIPDNEPVMTMATSVQHNLPINSAHSAPMNTISGASGSTAAVNMGNAIDALDKYLFRALSAEAKENGAGSQLQDAEPMEESSDEEDGGTILLADTEATEETSMLNDTDTSTVDSTDNPGVVVTEAVVNDTEVVVNTQAGLGPQDSTPIGHVPGQAGQVAVSDNSPMLDTGTTWLDAADLSPATNPANLLNNDAFAFAEGDHYPFNNHFSPENASILFDPFMGDGFNAYDMSDYFNTMFPPDSV